MLTLEAHTDEVDCVAFSPDGSILATSGESSGRRGDFYLWFADLRQRRLTAAASRTSAPLHVFSRTMQLQQWKIDDLGNGYVAIRCRASGKTLDASQSDVHTDGCRVLLFWHHGRENQQWEIVPLGDGYVKILCRASGKCLDGHRPEVHMNGCPVQLYEYANRPHQQWKIEPAGVGYGRIYCREGGKCLSASPSHPLTDDPAVQLWDEFEGRLPTYEDGLADE
jgi:WD40 repeat protein